MKNLGSRSRKQVFVTAKSTTAPESSSISKEKSPETGALAAASINTTEEDRDILEEDLNDLEYVPYPKTGPNTGRGRGRPPLKITKK